MSQVPSKTLLHELVNTKFANSHKFQVSATKENKPFTAHKDQFELYNDFTNTKQKNDPISAEANFWKDNINKITNLPPEFVVYWLDKFETTHPKVKEELKSNTNIEETIYQNFGDPITNIFRQDENISARYIPFDDIDFEANPPSPLTPILQDKLNVNIQTNILNSSTKVNSLFNNNINKLYDGSKQDQAHQSNLTTDYLHLQRLTENKPELLELVADYLGDLYEILLYIFNYKLNNIQKVFPATFNVNVEGKETEVDTLGNQVQKEKKYNTKDLIG